MTAQQEVCRTLLQDHHRTKTTALHSHRRTLTLKAQQGRSIGLCMRLTDVMAGGGLDVMVLGTPSTETLPPPTLLVFPPLPDEFTAGSGKAAAAAGAMAGAAEVAGEAARAGAVVLLLAAEAGPSVAFGDWVLKALLRDRVPATPWELSWACADTCCCNEPCSSEWRKCATPLAACCNLVQH